MSGQTTERIAAVVGDGRVWTKRWLAVFALCAAACAALAVYFAVAAALTRWEYAFAAGLAAVVAALCATFCARGLLLARRVRCWQRDAVRLRVKTLVTDQTASPAEIAVPNVEYTAFLQLPVSNPVLVIRFRYGDVTVVKTTPCRGVYRCFAAKEIEILYAPACDKVMLIARDDA